MNYKKALARVLLIIIFIISILFAFLMVVQMSDKSWMLTIDALGGGGWGSLSAIQERWILLLAAVIIASISVFIFVKSYRKESSK